MTSDTEKDSIRRMRESFHMTKQRCYNPSCRDYPYYGGRGITICDRWLKSFDNFLLDMGVRTEGMTLERRDVNGSYSPENCLWASRTQQMQNQRRSVKVPVGGVEVSLQEAADLAGVKYHTLKARIKQLGYTAEQALSKPVKSGERVEGRQYAPKKVRTFPNTPKGLESPKTFFSAEQLPAIRQLHRAGVSFSQIARDYGVTTTCASNAVQAKGAYKGT